MNETTHGTFNFDPEDQIYTEHFPGKPVVPGSLIIWAFSQALEAKGYKLKTIHLDQFRFRRFIGPGSYPFSLVPLDSGIKCILYNNHKTVAEGIIRL